jgi:glycosyltransferase involved in cell wall biosynthesis
VDAHPRVLVAIPCYCCANQIARVLLGFSEALTQRVDKVLLLDNQSVDETVPVAEATISQLACQEKFQIVVNERNLGLGGSQKNAFATAQRLGFDYVAILHGDDQAKTEELCHLIDEASRNPEIGAILGSRFSRKSKRQNYSRLRLTGNIALNWLYTVLSLQKTTDLGSGLNLFRVSALNKISFHNFSDGFTFNMDLLLALYRHRIPVRFVPISWREQDQVSNANIFRVGWASLKTVILWRLGFPKRNL